MLPGPSALPVLPDRRAAVLPGQTATFSTAWTDHPGTYQYLIYVPALEVSYSALPGLPQLRPAEEDSPLLLVLPGLPFLRPLRKINYSVLLGLPQLPPAEELNLNYCLKTGLPTTP